PLGGHTCFTLRARRYPKMTTVRQLSSATHPRGRLVSCQPLYVNPNLLVLIIVFLRFTRKICNRHRPVIGTAPSPAGCGSAPFCLWLACVPAAADRREQAAGTDTHATLVMDVVVNTRMDARNAPTPIPDSSTSSPIISTVRYRKIYS